MSKVFELFRHLINVGLKNRLSSLPHKKAPAGSNAFRLFAFGPLTNNIIHNRKICENLRHLRGNHQLIDNFTKRLFDASAS